MNSIILFVIIAVLVGMVLYIMNHTKEGFWMTPSRTLKVEKVYDGGFFPAGPGYQAQLSPRFSNVDYGPNLRTEMPSPDVMAVPIDPLSGDMNYRDAAFFDQDGTAKQPIVYDRFMYANRNSRLRGLGDPIRGDLPIAPLSGGWFVPSGAFEGPNVVLQQGAMNVMGGVNNETSRQLADLVYNTSGGTAKTIGGVDMSNYSMGTFFRSGASAGGDVAVTSFP